MDVDGKTGLSPEKKTVIKNCKKKKSVIKVCYKKSAL